MSSYNRAVAPYPVPVPKRNPEPELPELPSVPSGTVRSIAPPPDDLNFDDLTKRFEDLKKRK